VVGVSLSPKRFQAYPRSSGPGYPYYCKSPPPAHERRMMSEELYGVVFEEGGDTYLVAVFDVMS
jgi:hypothetical protein